MRNSSPHYIHQIFQPITIIAPVLSVHSNICIVYTRELQDNTMKPSGAIANSFQEKTKRVHVVECYSNLFKYFEFPAIE